MSHLRITTAPERNSPSLWPLPPNDRSRIEFSVEFGEDNSHALENLIVSLSDMILKTAAVKNSTDPFDDLRYLRPEKAD